MPQRSSDVLFLFLTHKMEARIKELEEENKALRDRVSSLEHEVDPCLMCMKHAQVAADVGEVLSYLRAMFGDMPRLCLMVLYYVDTIYIDLYGSRFVDISNCLFYQIKSVFGEKRCKSLCHPLYAMKQLEHTECWMRQHTFDEKWKSLSDHYLSESYQKHIQYVVKALNSYYNGSIDSILCADSNPLLSLLLEKTRRYIQEDREAMQAMCKQKSQEFIDSFETKKFVIASCDE